MLFYSIFSLLFGLNMRRGYSNGHNFKRGNQGVPHYSNDLIHSQTPPLGEDHLLIIVVLFPFPLIYIIL